MINRYYRDYINFRPKAEIVILSTDELDDDNLIALLEETPTYKRNAKEILQVRRKDDGAARPQGTAFQSSSANQGKKSKTGGTVISFR